MDSSEGGGGGPDPWTPGQLRHCLPSSFIGAPCCVLQLVTVRRSALHGLCDRNSIRLSVCLSVTLVDCVQTVRPTITISSPHGSPIILVSEDIKVIPKFEGGHPERGP